MLRPIVLAIFFLTPQFVHACSSGKPFAGFVTIQPADPAEAEAARFRGRLPGDEVSSDGKFSLPELPPGRYRLVFHPGTGRALNFRITFYWPPSPDEVIDLALGQHIEGVHLRPFSRTGLLARPGGP